MKLSKSLLQAILVGVTLGATATSCTKGEELIDKMQHQCDENCTKDNHSNNGGTLNPGNCPGCGMG